jgi:Flp pilus assembly protein TadD
MDTDYHLYIFAAAGRLLSAMHFDAGEEIAADLAYRQALKLFPQAHVVLVDMRTATVMTERKAAQPAAAEPAPV